MLAWIVRLALRHAALVAAFAVVVLIYGAMILTQSKYDVFPEFVPAQAEIQVEAPGLSPQDVERLITQPLENAINGGAEIAVVRSESIQGLAAINVVFTEGSDVFRDRQLLAERIAEVSASLPAGVKTPSLGPMTSSTMDLLKVGFTSDKLSGIELRTVVDSFIRPRLLAVQGVARAIVYGGGRREIQVQVDPRRLSALHLSFNDVVTAASAATSLRGAGFIDTANQRVLIANSGAANTPDQIAAVVLTQREGGNVRLGDVATVTYAAEPAFGDALVQGKPDVLVSISSQYGANTLEVTYRMEAALAELAPSLKAQGIEMHSNLHRPATFIESALRNMRDSLLFGALLVGIVLILFLRNWRTALISFVTIPLSLLAAIVVMERIGWTVNTMTLGGLAVAVGVVVDDAIIDVENILRRLRLALATQRVTALDAIVLNASLEVRRPIVLATFVVGTVFVPILMLPGLQGSFFAPLAAAFLLATFASLVFALTVTPALSLLLLRKSHRFLAEPRWLRRLKVQHRRWLRSSAPYGRALLIAALAGGVVALLISLRLGGELIPEFREGHFVAQVSGPAGASLSEMARVGANISRDVLAIPGVQTVSQQIGRAETGEDTWAPNRTEFHIELAPDLPAKEQIRIEDALRALFKSYVPLQSEVVTFLGDRISESISGETAAVVVNLFGTDLDVLDTTAEQAAALLRGVPGAADVRLDLQSSLPAIAIRAKPERLAIFGVRPAEVFDAVANAYQGAEVAQVYDHNQALAVRVILAPSMRQDPEAVGQLPITIQSGRKLPLSSLADVDWVSGRANIRHENGQRRQTITLNPTSTDVVGFVAVAKKELAQKLKLPPGVYMEFGGEAEGASAATINLLLHSALAAVGVVMLLFIAFRDTRSVALILANVPFAMLGGVIAVTLTGGSISIGSLVGFVTLFGISARNTIMLISHYEHLCRVDEARWNLGTALRGARERLTPILMTALVTALGLLPLAIGNGETGREVEGPMAVVILGGLISSTILNLMVMPALALKYLRPAGASA